MLIEYNVLYFQVICIIPTNGRMDCQVGPWILLNLTDVKEETGGNLIETKESDCCSNIKGRLHGR